MSFLCHPILACLRSIVNLLPGCSCIKGKGKKHLRTDDEETIVTQDKVVHPSSPVKTPVQSGTDSADSKTAEEKDDADAIQQSPSSEVRQPSSHLTQSSTPSSLGNQGSSAPGNDNNLDEARLDKVMRCEAMAQSLCVKFEQTGHLPDIDNAISALREALDIIPDQHEYMPKSLSNLAYLYEVRFDRSGFLEDINQSIAIRDQLLAEVASDVSQRPGRLIGLAVLLCSRFQHSGELVDIDKAISLEREAISLVPEDDASYFRYMSHLGMALSIRFERKGQRVDLDESISVQERTISLAPDDYPGKPNYYNNFGGTLLRRFEYLGDLADIGRAISMGQRAVSLVPDGHPVKPEYLSNLSTSYAARFERLGDLPDLEQSIMAAANAISLAPYPTAGLYSTLGGAYSSRFRRLGEPNDLDKAIECNRVSMSLVPEGHAAKPIYLNNLSISLRNRFLHLGQLSDIDAAILQEQQAVGLTPPDHSDYPQYVGNLATMLSLRFLQLGESKDIDEAIALAKRAVNATPKEHPALPDRLTILANCFTRRYERFGATAGIDDAILAYREAVDLTADDDRMKPGRLNNLGGPLLRRFEHFGSPQEADLELAISVLQKATSLTQEGHAETPLILSNLGMALRDRYQHRGRIEDIRESITKLEQAVSLTPDALSAKSRYLNNLGDSFAALFERSDNRTGSADKAIEAFKTSAKSIGGSPSLRLYAAREWAKIYLKRDGVPSLEAHTIVMSLVPRIVWLGSGISQRYDDVIAISDAVNEAAAAAIQLQDYTSALEWLEQGRAIAERILYSTVAIAETIPRTSPAPFKNMPDAPAVPSRTLRCCETLSHHPHLADVVRRFHLRWETERSSRPSRTSSRSSCTSDSPRTSPRGFCDHFPVFTVPSLRHLSLGGMGDSPAQLLRNHPGLLHFKLADYHAPLALAPADVPRLASFRGNPVTAASILPGRPVHWLSLVGWEFVTEQDLARIAQTSTPIRTLDLSAMSVTPILLRDISRHLSSIEFLRVKLALRHTLHFALSGIVGPFLPPSPPIRSSPSSSTSASAFCARRLLAALTTVLGEFQELRALDLSPTNAVDGVGVSSATEEEQLCLSWMRACPSLRRITFPSKTEWTLIDGGFWVAETQGYSSR
ncbi:hypothetical protein EVG20_g5684 [Dentipellis fragilis]|uniref:MalT-like TPR region domain-containing protein n=1 Tax=Dentipellis fragilis TaxID=205917 RepID=A0A4Y9YUH1_9AGAM|nr:hypothetical protein EVG20_g5684 [Dentipellis fragilis]